MYAPTRTPFTCLATMSRAKGGGVSPAICGMSRTRTQFRSAGARSNLLPTCDWMMPDASSKPGGTTTTQTALTRHLAGSRRSPMQITIAPTGPARLSLVGAPLTGPQRPCPNQKERRTDSPNKRPGSRGRVTLHQSTLIRMRVAHVISHATSISSYSGCLGFRLRFRVPAA